MTTDHGAEAALFDVEDFRGDVRRNLRERFVVPPFSVLDAAVGSWQTRKRNWLALGIRSETGRDAKAYTMGLNASADNGLSQEGYKGSGTSVFDPVLCEIVYRWWSPPGGTVLDPFAGGSVRGVVAALLGRAYVGMELRGEQVAANEAQRDIIADAPGIAAWMAGDSATDLPDISADLVFTCPPYGDLERYSDDPRDISSISDPAAFAIAYAAIIDAAVARLRRDRFAVVVVGNYRDRAGYLVDLIGTTVRAFEAAGCRYHGELVLVTSVGTAAVRASAAFDAGRKPTRRHQSVLVFVKGDGRAAARAAEDLPGGAP